LAVALLALTEALSIARAMAIRSGQRIDGNQEFIGQGLSNLVGSFFSGYASSGSFNRSGLNYAAGAQTPLSTVFSAVALLLILLFLAPLARYLPTAAMAGILFVVAWGLIDFRHIREIIQAGRQESAVLAVTFVATLTLQLEFAIYAGVLLSLMLYLHPRCKAHHHRVRHKVDQGAQTQQAKQQLKQSNQKGQRQHQTHITLATRWRQRAHGGKHHNRDGSGGARHQVPGRAPQSRHNRRQHGSIKTVLWRHAGDGGKGHALGHQNQATGQAGKQVAAQAVPVHTGPPQQKGQHGFQKTNPRRPIDISPIFSQKKHRLGALLASNWHYHQKELALLLSRASEQTL
ncbi:MAG: SulP family inorganic anion transporter, partial [Betaproteobacteria bacterium]|nr:SulP family inorganic anion transporter [Betaproteobacteria bacterium]